MLFYLLLRKARKPFCNVGAWILLPLIAPVGILIVTDDADQTKKLTAMSTAANKTTVRIGFRTFFSL
jgi:hypothetical protein